MPGVEDCQGWRWAMMPDILMSGCLWQGYCTRLGRQKRSLWTTANTISEDKSI